MDRRSRHDPNSIFRIELGAFLRVCKGVNTPRSLACFMLAEAGEWGQYLELPFPDTNSHTFQDDYLVTEMMRKNPHLPNLNIDRKAVALEKFHESERQCAETNSRLREFTNGTISVPSDVRAVISHAQLIISGILGPLTRAKLEYAEAHFRFGPGATSSLSGRDVILSKKMTCTMQVAPRLYPYLQSLLPPTWRERISNLEIRGYSKVTTVPKSAKTDRCIAIEPHLNIYVQLGIGALLKRQLTLAGLDLRSQKHNQDAARNALKQGLATVDLSSASDTVSSELVWLMLPYEWASLLDVARTEYAVVEGEEVRLSKFSSMGNGYTFELETLIFWALAQACSPDAALAYGDDIIVKQESVPLLFQALNFLGFSVNSKKSFWQGDFFESCGADFWRGINVRPFYFKGEYYDLTSAVIRMANAIRRYASRRGGGLFCDRRFLPAWLYLLSRSSLARETSIPDGIGDDGLVRNFDEACPSKLRRGWQGYLGRVYRVIPAKARNTDFVGSYLAALAFGSFESPRSSEYWRGEFKGAQLTSIPCFTWDDLGPWA